MSKDTVDAQTFFSLLIRFFVIVGFVQFVFFLIGILTSSLSIFSLRPVVFVTTLGSMLLLVSFGYYIFKESDRLAKLLVSPTKNIPVLRTNLKRRDFLTLGLILLGLGWAGGFVDLLIGIVQLVQLSYSYSAILATVGVEEAELSGEYMNYTFKMAGKLELLRSILWFGLGLITAVNAGKISVYIFNFPNNPSNE